MSGLFANLTSIRMLVIACAGLLFSGCAADQYFMVEKNDLRQLDDSLSSQNRQLESLEDDNAQALAALAQLESMARQNQTSTESILAAVRQQAENFSCPPAPEAPACKITDDNDTAAKEARADRLEGMLIVGQLERLYLPELDMVHVARIDSGANTSSIDARNITRFERDGVNWVRFEIPDPDTADFVTLEREVSRLVKIIQSSADEAEQRVVVELQFMIGDHHHQAEFTLTSREHLSNVVLVGRNILKDVMLIDVGKEHATRLPSPLPHQEEGE